MHCTKISVKFEFGSAPPKCGVGLPRWENQRRLSSVHIKCAHLALQTLHRVQQMNETDGENPCKQLLCMLNDNTRRETFGNSMPINLITADRSKLVLA